MRVLLIDCDWEEGVTLSPNPWLLKTSSFFKQQEHTVELSKGDFDYKSQDVIIIFKEMNTDYLPPVNILNSQKTRLCGEALKTYPNYWQVSESISKARPDYYLYPDKHLTTQDYAVFSHGGRLITPQDFVRNEKSTEDTVVIDNIWELSDEDLVTTMRSLAKYSRVHFLHPINFLRFNDEILKLFLHLSLSKRENNSKIIATKESLTKTINFVKLIKESKRFNISPIPILAATKSDHSSQRFQDCLEMIGVANRAQAKIRFLVPNANYDERPLFDYLKLYNQKRSFVEYIIKLEMRGSPQEFINKTPKGISFAVDLATELYNKRPEVFKDASVSWGGAYTHNIKKIGENNI